MGAINPREKEMAGSKVQVYMGLLPPCTESVIWTNDEDLKR